MKRKITLTLLLLLCMTVLTGCFCQHEVWNPADCINPKTCAECGEIEGAPLGHSWLVATCDTPKTCEACAATEGDPLGHVWIEATYEAPQTCSVCNATEGEPLPPPFLGIWVTDRVFTCADLGITDFEYTFTATYHYTFAADGTLTTEIRQDNAEALLQSVKNFYIDYLYYVMEVAYGLDRDALDAALAAEGSQSVEEIAGDALVTADLESVFATANSSGTYYIKDGNLHIAISFTDILSDVVSDPNTPNTFTVEGDTLTLNWDSTDLDEPLVLTRVSE